LKFALLFNLRRSGVSAERHHYSWERWRPRRPVDGVAGETPALPEEFAALF